MALVSLPNDLQDGVDTASGAEVLANDTAITAQVNGNLEDVNISASAGIKGTKLSASAGSRIPTDRIEDDAVTADKLADSATSALRAVTTSHIRDGAVTAAQLGALAVVSGKVKILTKDWVIGSNIPGNSERGSNSEGIYLPVADGVPLFMSIESSGVPAAQDCSLITNIKLDTAANRWYMCVRNAQVGSAVFVVSGYTFRLYYIATS